MNNIWNKLFLEERPSISLSLFRIAVAITVGAHVIPTLCNLTDNYYATAFKTYNFNFFTPDIISLVQRSSDGFVLGAAIFFLIVWLFFLIGLFTQVNCILMTLSCYYFYALNSFHIGTLSWDILLVTLFLMCLTSYPGDYFSVDALRRGDTEAFKRKRPFFLQRLLQMQIAFTFFYTGLYKISPAGNWITDNPMYYLMNEPPAGVTKWFLVRDFVMDKPQVCYVIGVMILSIELLMPFLLFCRKTRLSAIYLGVFFHGVLLLTMDVPAIFFFLFPAQLFLFINPEHIVGWVEQKRMVNAASIRAKLIYDGNCGFCRNSVRQLLVMDLFRVLHVVDFQQLQDPAVLHPDLTKEKCTRQMYLIEPNGRLYGGFDVFRRICFTLPMLYPMIFVFYFPGAGIVGPRVYQWVAKHRDLFNVTCLPAGRNVNL